MKRWLWLIIPGLLAIIITLMLTSFLSMNFVWPSSAFDPQLDALLRANDDDSELIDEEGMISSQHIALVERVLLAEGHRIDTTPRAMHPDHLIAYYTVLSNTLQYYDNNWDESTNERALAISRAWTPRFFLEARIVRQFLARQHARGRISRAEHQAIIDLQRQQLETMYGNELAGYLETLNTPQRLLAAHYGPEPDLEERWLAWITRYFRPKDFRYKINHAITLARNGKGSELAELLDRFHADNRPAHLENPFIQSGMWIISELSAIVNANADDAYSLELEDLDDDESE